LTTSSRDSIRTMRQLKSITCVCSCLSKTVQFSPPGTRRKQVPTLISQRNKAQIWLRLSSRPCCLALLQKQTLATLKALWKLSLRLAVRQGRWTSAGSVKLTGEVGIVEWKTSMDVVHAGRSLLAQRQRPITPSGINWPQRLVCRTRNPSTVLKTMAVLAAVFVTIIFNGTNLMGWSQMKPIHTLGSRALRARISPTERRSCKFNLSRGKILRPQPESQKVCKMEQLFFTLMLNANMVTPEAFFRLPTLMTQVIHTILAMAFTAMRPISIMALQWSASRMSMMTQTDNGSSVWSFRTRGVQDTV